MKRRILDEETLNVAVAFVEKSLGKIPETAIVLGSGLGSFAESLKSARKVTTSEIPGYPGSTVEGHKGLWVLGKHAGKDVLAVQGRIHAYEGLDHSTVSFPIHLMASLGVKNLIITNAAGAINRFYAPGDLMVIDDVLNLSFRNPLWGFNNEKFGPRFPDMCRPFAPDLIELALREAADLGVKMHKGVYLGLHGPSYETAAEIRMAEKMGADAVGMSTVPETISGVYRNSRILGISCITNMGTGLEKGKLSHKDVQAVADRIKEDFKKLIGRILGKIG
mgnify:CR=1 FL=1